MFRIRSQFQPIEKVVALKHLGEASAVSYGPTLTMISWNMFKARRAGCMPDLTTMAGGIELACLQEAVLQGGLAHPFHLSRGLEWIMAENLGTVQAMTTGPKTGSRVASLRREAIRSLDREPFIGTPKTFLLTTYPFCGTELLVLNVHAINLVSTAKFARQVEQMVAPVVAHKGPCIVAGDFNTWNPARWQVLLKAMSHAGLARVPVAAPQLRHFNQVLDHVFYRGLKLLNARPLSHIKSSDHVPLWAEFAPV
jgi:endonuclease/exonuclease/phosphatase family metal-dependent hydrolase